MPLTKEEKRKLLQDRMSKVKKEIAELNKKEQAQKRKERARKLIETGAYFFGDDYEAAFDLIKNDITSAEDLRGKITRYISSKKAITNPENNPSATPLS